MAGQGSTTEQLRSDIDSGRAGSKIDHPDPAAAPLGTDDEAGGTPTSPAAVSAARREEAVSSPAETKQERLGTGAYVYAAMMGTTIVILSGIAVWMSS